MFRILLRKIDKTTSLDISTGFLLLGNKTVK